MLRKRYLVSPGYFHNTMKQQQDTNIETKPQPKKNIAKKRLVKKPKQTQHPYNKWLKIRENLQDAQVQRKTFINAFKDFLKQVLPDTKAKVEPKLETLHSATQSSPPQPPRPLSRRSVIRSPTTSKEVIYETSTKPKTFPKPSPSVEVEGYYEPLIEQEVLDYNRKQFGVLASPYVSPYVYKTANIPR
jgi:pullulanase/glycogen debranching enzyme